MIGARVKLVREILNFTQEEFGELIGTTQSGVASIEAGVYGLSPQYLEVISQRTGFTQKFFERGELPDFPFGSNLYRAQSGVKIGPRFRAHAFAHVLFEFAVSLAAKLKAIPINVPRSDEAPDISAQITRTALGLSPLSPIRNLISVLERNGVMIFSLPIEIEGFDGFSAWAGNPQRPVIILLRGKTAYREVFTIGEEIAHLVMHAPLRISPKEADLQARQFAQEFLLPADAMRTEMQTPITLSTLARLKARWGVSMSFLAKRADFLGLLTANQYRYLIQQMRAAWGSKEEPGDQGIEPERPRLLRKMIEMQYGTPIPIPKVAKDSGLPASLLRTSLELPELPGSAKVLEFRR